MKSIFSLLACFFWLFCLGCAETNSLVIQENQGSNEFLLPFAENISPADYPDGWVTLTDADVDELMNLVIPPNFHKMNISEEWKKKYTHAALLKQFGDLPEVRYIIEFQRNPGFEVSHELFTAYFLAHYRLFPNEHNRRTLEKVRNIENQPIPEPPLLRKVVGEPITVERAEEIRIELIEKHGDIPQVHTVVDFFIKAAEKKTITDDEFLAYLEAQHQLEPHNEHIRQKLETYKKAKADGIPFHLVDGEDE